LLAEGCLLAQPVERLLWKEQTLKIHKSAAIFDPQETLVKTYLQQSAVAQRVADFH
jgi:hypothetical protein